MRVKNRSRKRDFKYKRERDNAFLRGRDAGIVRYTVVWQDTGLQFLKPERHCPRGGC